MALDSKEKRIAVLGVARPWMRDIFPVSGKDREWRSSIGLSYPVANFQSPGGITPAKPPSGLALLGMGT